MHECLHQALDIYHITTYYFKLKCGGYRYKSPKRNVPSESASPESLCVIISGTSTSALQFLKPVLKFFSFDFLVSVNVCCKCYKRALYTVKLKKIGGECSG